MFLDTGRMLDSAGGGCEGRGGAMLTDLEAFATLVACLVHDLEHKARPSAALHVG